MKTKYAVEKIGKQKNVEVERSLEQLAYWLDDVVRIPIVGWRFGLDSIAGLVPGFGDTATTIVSFYVLIAAVRYRVPKITILRMALNLAIDYIFGSIPILGDVFDFFWKSNRKNIDLLKERATVSASDAKINVGFGDWLFVGGVMLFLLLVLLASFAVTIYLLSLVLRYANVPLF
ncbi:MAG: DUF4112 domain-containing protein [Pyrinomonadaceae bacterium]|nr:DUF4112 domain-containing protein [Pyrinomonadaceae bacterium]